MELIDKREAEIAAMARKELNAHAFLCEQEQEEYERELRAAQEEIAKLKEGLSENLAKKTAAYESIEEWQARAIQAEQERDRWKEEALLQAKLYLQKQRKANDAKGKVRQLTEERNALLEGLKFYANAYNYVQQYQPDGPFKFKSKIDDDNNGGLARSIIAKITQE